MKANSWPSSKSVLQYRTGAKSREKSRKVNRGKVFLHFPWCARCCCRCPLVTKCTVEQRVCLHFGPSWGRRWLWAWPVYTERKKTWYLNWRTLRCWSSTFGSLLAGRKSFGPLLLRWPLDCPFIWFLSPLHLWRNFLMDHRFRFQQQDTEMHCQSYFAKRKTFRNGNSSRRSSPPSRLTFGNTTSPGEYTPMPDRAYPWLTHTSITVQPNGVQLALKRACYFPQPTSRFLGALLGVLFKIQQGRSQC